MTTLTEIKSRILEHVPLKNLVAEQVSLKQQSGRALGCCPFHEENTPSFYVFKDHYHCFGCGAHGDSISFVRNTQGLGFVETLKWLNQRFSLNLTFENQNNLSKNEAKSFAIKNNILNITHNIYKKLLLSSEGSKAYQYLLSRGFSREEIEQYEFGFAPSGQNFLWKNLQSQRFSNTQVQDCSLITNYGEKVYDFFRNRLMIPIHNRQGHLIAFAGRALDNLDPQKYKNSRYDKSSVLFGLDRARQQIHKNKRVIVVEGYLDAMSLWSFGFEETVACQGTALTAKHISSLKSVTNEIFLLFDGDKAGQQAALKVSDHIPDLQGIACYVGTLPQGQDPDSFIREKGKEQLEEILKNSQELSLVALKSYLQSTSKSLVPSLIREKFLPWLAAIKDPLEKSHLAIKIENLTGISQNILIQNSRSPSKNTLKAPLLKTQTPTNPRYLFDFIGYLYFNDHTQIDLQQINDFYNKYLDSPEPLAAFLKELINLLNKKGNPHTQALEEWSSLSQKAEIGKLLYLLQKKKEAFLTPNPDNKLNYLITSFKKQNLKKTILSLKQEISLLNLNSNDDKECFIRILTDIKKIQNDYDKL
jgi:DNA primase